MRQSSDLHYRQANTESENFPLKWQFQLFGWILTNERKTATLNIVLLRDVDIIHNTFNIPKT